MINSPAQTLVETETDRLLTRILHFSDAVFAVAAGVLALQVRPPEFTFVTDTGGAVGAWLPLLGVAALIFLVLAHYWVMHHLLFSVVTAFEGGVMWLNLLFLMGVVFLPIVVGSAIAFPGEAAVVALAAGWLALVGWVQVALWAVVRGGGQIFAGAMNVHAARYISTRLLIAPIVLSLSITLTPLSPSLALLSWLLIPVLLILLARITPAAGARNL